MAIVVPRVTCDLPVHLITFSPSWTHLYDIPLADPDFGCPGRVDILLGVDVFTAALLHGRRVGPSGTPVAFETVFGWALAVQPTSLLQNPLPYLTTHLSPQTTIYYADFGKSRRARNKSLT